MRHLENSNNAIKELIAIDGTLNPLVLSKVMALNFSKLKFWDDYNNLDDLFNYLSSDSYI
jgi:hypothetical protein